MFWLWQPGLHVLQSRSASASHWVKGMELQSVIAVWAAAFALKVTHAQLYATAALSWALKDQRLLYSLFQYSLLGYTTDSSPTHR